MATTKTRIISQAFELLGHSQILILTPESNPHHASASRFYDRYLRTVLTEHSWRFAMETRELTKELEEPINDRWNYQFIIPLDVLSIYRVSSNHYTIFGDRIYTLAEQRLLIECIQEITTDKFPPWFETLMIFRMAEYLALKLTQKAEFAKYWHDEADRQFIKARSSDMRQIPSQKVKYDPIYTAHFTA